METLRIGPLGFTETAFLDLTGEQWREMTSALEQSMFALQHFVRGCEGEGSAVVVSSAAAARAMAGCTLDAVAGAFLTTVAQVAAIESKPRGIRVNVLVPARPPAEETIAAAAGLLATAEARAITGAVIAVDGGFSVTKEVGGKPPIGQQ